MTLAIVFGVAAVVALAAFLYMRHLVDGPTAPIVVVDRRTLRLAKTRIDQAIGSGDIGRAYAGLTTMVLWLRHETQCGPRRHRIEYAHELELAELQRSQLAPAMGLQPGPELH